MGAIVSRRRLLQAGLAAGAAMAFGVGLRLDRAAPGAHILSADELRVVGALAEVMFPRGAMPIDGLQAGVPDKVDRLLAEVLEAPHRAGFRYVLRALEWGTLAARGVRFSQLPPGERLEVLEAWKDPSILPRRVAGDSLKLVLGTAYFNHPKVLGHIGWRAACGGGEA